MKTKRRPKKGISPLYIIIAIAALLLTVYAVVQHFNRRAEIENDPHYGMVEVFNGESYVWVVPEEDVPKNTLKKDDFATDPDGNITYVGGEYKASRGVDVSEYQGDIDWQAVYDSGVGGAGGRGRRRGERGRAR